MNCRVRTWRVSGKRAVTGWWPQLNRNGSAIMSNLKSRKVGERSSVSLRRAMKASKKCAYCSSRHIAPTVLKAWHCAGAKVVRKKTVLFIKGRRSVFWPTFKSCASAAQREARRLNSLCRVARFVLTWAEFRPQSFATSYPLYAEQPPNRSEWERS